MAGKPDYNIRAKSKTTGNSIYVMAFWRGEKGIGGQFDREIAKIVLKDGRVLSPDSVYLDLFENNELNQEQPKGTDEHIQQAPPDSEIPF